MNKNSLFILMAFLLCQSFIIGFNQQNYNDYYNSLPKAADDDYESNDSYDQATPFEYPYYYDMFILQDIDWFVISLNAGDNITIMIETDSYLAEMEINFFESNGITPVAGAVLGGNGTFWMIAVPNLPETGNYYFSLLPLGDPFAYYFLEIEYDQFDDIYEENDDIANAIDISEDDPEDLLYCLDDDWFKIYLEEGSSILLDFAYYKTGSFELDLIGTDGTTILNAFEEYFEEDYGIVWKESYYNESVINTTGYYYIHVSSDTPTIYIFYCDVYSVNLFEDSLTIYQYSNNEIRLQWEYLENSEFYYVFRETSQISSVDGLTPYATTGETWFWDYFEESGIYYYVVMANNGTHNSSISNCVNVTILPFDEMPLSLYLYQYGENYIEIYWNYLENAEFYYIFRENSEITTVDGLTPIAITESTYYQESIEENGTYYYVIMAFNGTHNSSISNCVNVTVRSFEEIPINLYLYQYGQEINLDWDYIANAEFYYVFRETSEIITVDGLTPFANSSYSGYYDIITENGTFYYVVMANNGTHNTSISNCVNVTILIYPFNEIVPELEPIIPSNDEDGAIQLDWDSIYNATSYYIFRETSTITTIDGLTPIANSTYSGYYDQINENGTYYYVIVANNGAVNSTISNCESVTCSIIPFYEQEPYITRLSTDYQQTGEVRIRWTHINKAIEYYVYRDTSPISDIGGLAPIATVDLEYLEYNSYFYDQVYENGTYYYVVVANNGSTNSTPSSCKSIEVSIKPFYERVPYFYVYPYESYNGEFTLEWECVPLAVEYYIFRETTYITDIDGLTPIATIPDDGSYWMQYYDIVQERGTYYYVIVANNGSVNSQISYCREVKYEPYQPGDPISIYSNSDLYDLKLQGIITGEGTEENPYILEDLVIDTGFSGSAIDIRNTDAYLIIRDCTILNSGIHNEEAAGISISSCSNIKIMNCFLDNNEAGIYLIDNSYNNIVLNNTLLHTDGFTAIALSGAHDNQILNNILEDNDCYAINLFESENNEIAGNILINNHGGIQVEYSHYNEFFENEITESGGGDGIKLASSNENTITRNKFVDNTKGIYLYLSSSNNLIYYNDIYGNEAQAFEEEQCTGNQWDDGTHGNYWGNDYISRYPDATNDGTIWDTPFEIDGAGLGIDNFPLVDSLYPEFDPPQFTYVPEDFNADKGYTGLNIKWMAEDLHPATYAIELNGTEVVAATAWTSGNRIMYDIPDGLLEGDHNITIIISDESGNTAQNTVIFTVNKSNINVYIILTSSLVFGGTASIIIISILKRRKSLLKSK